MRVVVVLLLVLLTVAGVHTAGFPPIVLGAVYPTRGGQGRGGLEEFRGVNLATEYVNRLGGLWGRPVRLRLESADSYDAAPAAVERLANEGIKVVMGSHGSTISRPAADAATRLGLVFWETGAVGELSMSATSAPRVFRFTSAGTALGRAAVTFTRDQLSPRVRPARPWRYAVVYVDDVYGRSVAEGATAEITRSGLPMAAAVPYTLPGANYLAIASLIRDARADVLVVAAYLDDGVSLRRALVRLAVPLAVNIGTSSSYCMPEFGRILGDEALGVFASDKPDGDVLRDDALQPAAAEALQWARRVYRRRYGEAMSAPALSGFAGGVALFHHVLPQAGDLTPDHVARAIRTVRLPLGALPNGSGLAFGPSGHPDSGSNSMAASVIWEWIRPNTRAVVWPGAFATHSIVFP